MLRALSLEPNRWVQGHQQPPGPELLLTRPDHSREVRCAGGVGGSARLEVDVQWLDWGPVRSLAQSLKCDTTLLV